VSDPLLEPLRVPAPTPPEHDASDQPGDEIPERRSSQQRHSRPQRLVLALNVVVILACFAGAVGLIIGKRVRENIKAAPQASVVTVAQNQPVNSDGVFVGDPNVTFPAADPAAQNFLVVGDDSHACVSPDSPWAGAADPARADLGQRSDTIMIIRIDPASHRAAVLSFPRDLWVKVAGKKTRINSAYRKGDYTLLAQTLYDSFQVRVDHYVQVDFCAFKTVVDAVGGVKVPFQFPARDTHIGLDISATGCHTFSGDEALAYVRSRYYEYQDTDGTWKGDNAYDLGRISRQQDFLRRMLETAVNKGVFNASVAKGLLDTLTKYVVVDQQLTIDGMLQFVGVLHDVQALGIPTYQIEVTRLLLPGNDVLQPQLGSENMQAILRIFRGQAALAEAPVQNPAAATPPAAGIKATTTTTTTGAPGPTTTVTVVDPTATEKGIVPPKDVVC
jgi:LCP family protein required for cell wall assembly